MPRSARVEGAGLYHHVTGHSHPTRVAFPDDVALRGFLALLATTARDSSWHVLAYCLLATHYHLLVLTDNPNLGAGMRRIHSLHTQRSNHRLGQSGPLWRDRFHSTVVRDGRHVVRAAAYIDVNPVAAGIVGDPADWRWSSYRANAGLAKPWVWHRPDLVYGQMGVELVEAPAVYRDIVAATAERSLAKRAQAPDVLVPPTLTGDRPLRGQSPAVCNDRSCVRSRSRAMTIRWISLVPS